VRELRTEHRLADLLRAARLARATFYYQCKALDAGDRFAQIKAKISAIYARHKGRYGYRRITAEIQASGQAINHKTVQRLMCALGLKSLVRPKRYRSYKGKVGPIAPNLLARDFSAERVNQKWVTDVTEFNVKGQKLYLSPIMDLYNGEIIAWQTSERPHYAFVGKMLEQAIERVRGEHRPILHSDQGWQYQMADWQRKLAKYGVVQSMSRRGNCLDNAAMESFFATLKSEFFYLNRFESIEQLRNGLRQYIHYYNHQRISLKRNGLSPVQYRTQPASAG